MNDIFLYKIICIKIMLTLGVSNNLLMSHKDILINYIFFLTYLHNLNILS